jgi:SAM-dependent methyltransferase
MSEREFRETARFYDEVYHSRCEAEPVPSAHFERLAKRLAIAPDHRVLDVACGTGAWLLSAANRGAEISGIDISERAINACCRVLPQGDFRTGKAEALPFPDDAFDLVTCLGALEHFIDPKSALREMVRVAKQEARLLILVPNSGFPTYRLGLFCGTQQRTVRETILSLDEWQALFQGAGLRVTERWKDLHVLAIDWIFRRPYPMAVPRALQALALATWPLEWQYQVYHLCRKA